MINLTLRQLKYFDALARQGHFGRAAEICAVSQPALSMQIKEMEATLGAPLLERGPRKVSVTPFGQAVLDHARDILRRMDDLEALARDTATGTLRLGIIPTIAPYLLPRIVGHLSARYPDMELQVRETLTPRLLDELRDGVLDLALLALPSSEPTLEEAPLFTEAFVLVRPDDEADLPVPNADDLSTMRLLLLEEGHCFRDQALAFCNMRAPLSRETLEGSALSTLVQMVGAGIGVTLIPEMAVAVEARAAPVAIARFPEPQPKRTLGLVWRKSSPMAAQFQDIADVLRALAP